MRILNMKILITLFLSLCLFSATVAQDESVGEYGECSDSEIVNKVKNAINSLSKGTEGDDVTAPQVSIGSLAQSQSDSINDQECYSIMDYKTGGSFGTSNKLNDYIYAKYEREAACENVKDQDACILNSIKESVEEGSENRKQIVALLRTCQMLHSISSINDFDDEADESTVLLGGAAPNGNNQEQQQAPQAAGLVMSCEKSNSFTADFKSCNKAVTEINAFTLAEAGIAIKHQTQLQRNNETIENQLNQKRQDGTLEQNDPLIAQRDGLRFEAKLLQERLNFILIPKELALAEARINWINDGNIEGRCEGIEGCCLRAVTESNIFYQNNEAKAVLEQAVVQNTKEIFNLRSQIRSLEDRANQIQLLSDQFNTGENLAGVELTLTYCESPQGQADTRCQNIGSGFNNNLGAFGGGDIALGVAAREALTRDANTGFNPAEVEADINRRGSGSPSNPNPGFADTNSGGSGEIAGGLSPGSLNRNNEGGGGAAGAGSANAGATQLSPSERNIASEGDDEPINKTEGDFGSYGSRGRGGASYSRVFKKRAAGKKKEKKPSKELFNSLFDKLKPGRDLAQAKDVKGKQTHLFRDISRRYDIVEGEERLIKAN